MTTAARFNILGTSFKTPDFPSEFLGRTNCEKASVARSCATRAIWSDNTGALATATRSKKFKNFTRKLLKKDGFSEVPLQSKAKLPAKAQSFRKIITALCLIILASCAQKPAKIIDRSKVKYGKSNQLNREKYRNIRPRDSKLAAKKTSDRNDSLAQENSQNLDEVVVDKGDNLYSIARQNDVSIRELIDANNLSAPYILKIGEVVKIPRGKFHEVREGETLYSISRSYEMKVDDLIALNSMKFPYMVQLGDKLRISKIAKDSTETKTAQSSNPNQKPAKLENDESAIAKNQERQSMNANEKEARSGNFSGQTADKASHFSWPAKGKVISRFGPKSGGLYNDGINIKGNAGDPILASEDGSIAYVGNELKGYGNLIIIKHAGGWLTAYAHLKDSSVHKDQKVKRGQKIGSLGSTGKVSSPQLYFGLRKGNDAVNPENYLQK